MKEWLFRIGAAVIIMIIGWFVFSIVLPAMAWSQTLESGGGIAISPGGADIDTSADYSDDNGKIKVATPQFVYDNIGSGSMDGSGTTGYIPKFTGAAAIGNSAFTEAALALALGDTAAYNDIMADIRASVDANTSAITGKLDKSDTTSQVRQTHPALPNVTPIASPDSQRVLTVDASGNIGVGWDDVGSGSGGGDSVKTVVVDTARAGSVFIGDTLRATVMWHKLPVWLPDHAQTTSYDSQKRSGWIQFTLTVGGNILRDVTSPSEFGFVSDSANTVELRWMEIIHIDEGSAGHGDRCTEFISLQTGTTVYWYQECTTPWDDVEFQVRPTGTRNALNFFVTSGTGTASWSEAVIRIGYVIDNGQESSVPVMPVNL